MQQPLFLTLCNMSQPLGMPDLLLSHGMAPVAREAGITRWTRESGLVYVQRFWQLQKVLYLKHICKGSYSFPENASTTAYLQNGYLILQHIPSTLVPGDAVRVEQKPPEENGFWKQTSLTTRTIFLPCYQLILEQGKTVHIDISYRRWTVTQKLGVSSPCVPSLRYLTYLAQPSLWDTLSLFLG